MHAVVTRLSFPLAQESLGTRLTSLIHDLQLSATKLTIQISTTPMIFVLLENFEVGVGRDVGVAHVGGWQL